MKKTIILITALILLLKFCSFSQNMLEKNRLIYSELDTGRITTGILYDRVIPISGIEKYDGQNNQIICKQSIWKQIYFELQNASNIKDTTTTNNLDFIFGRKLKFADGKLIPIYLINYKYNKIKENAFDDELLLIDDDKIVENPDKNVTPYNTNRVFVAAPYKKHTYYGNNFNFIFNDNFLFTNTNEKICELFADFDDGFGKRKVYLYEKINLNYNKIGIKTISLTAITSNLDTLKTKFEFEVKAKSTPEYSTIRFQTELYTGKTRWFCPCNNVYYGTEIEAKAACTLAGCWPWQVEEEKICRKGGTVFHFKSPVTPNSIDRILLIVEGFDIGDNMFAPELWDIFNKQKLAECMLANNYDIFIANYDVPSDDITYNAEYIKRVIRHINNNLKTNKTELVIAGGSMGGLVTRVAITQMEQNGEDIQTRLWFSFDSPQKGANIPLGLQYWIQELNNSLYVAGGFLEKLRKKAAKQMMLYHFDDYPNTSTDRINFAQLLENLGMPQTCRNIAITNGASDGSNQDYTDGTKLIHITWKVPLARRRYIYAWAVQNGGGDFVVCKKVKMKNNGDEILMKEYKANNTMPLDAAPGGYRPSMKEIGEMNTYGLATIDPYEDNHAFIPAVSALGIDANQVENGYYYDFYNENSTVLLSKTHFDNIFFPRINKDENQPHVWVSFETAENIINELFPQDVVLGDVNPDWQQGEIQATNSIRLSQGFHASSSDRLHAHIVEPIINLEPEGWEDLFKNNEKTTKINPPETEITETENIKIYPNPTTGKFTIELNAKFQNFSNSKIIITDLTGKIIKQLTADNSQIKIDITNKPNGLYFLKIKTQNKILTHKIIKL